MESIIYKDLYIMKDLFGGFQIQTLKFLKGIFLTIQTKKELSIHFHSLSLRTQNSKQIQQNFSSPPVCNTEICFPLTCLPTETTLQRYIYSSPATKVFSRRWQ